jgi:hypothetical protein
MFGGVVQQFQGAQQRNAGLHQGRQLAGEAGHLLGARWSGRLGLTLALDADGPNALRMQMGFNVSAVQGGHLAALILALRIAACPRKPRLRLLGW